MYMYMYIMECTCTPLYVTTREVHVFGHEKDPEFLTLYILSVFASEAEVF